MLKANTRIKHFPVTVITKLQLLGQLNHLVARTERGNAIVQRNPREMPRRLRVLLLAVDGSHTVELYVKTLKGFGDIGDLLVELMGLGLVSLRNPNEVVPTPANHEPYAELNQLLDDSRFGTEQSANVLYGATAPGSFDEMLRVAQLESPQYVPPPPSPPAPISLEIQKAQIESLFDLLEAVRGERRGLKYRLKKMDKIKTVAVQLDKENQRLFKYVFMLSTVCVALAVALLIVWLKR